MFEVVIMLCLANAPQLCRPVLQPGFAAATRAECEAIVPEGAECQSIGPSLEFTEVAPDVFVHMGRIEEPDTVNLGDVSNLGFVIGQHSVAVVDSGSARWIGEATYRSIREVTDKPISHVVLTHMHPDHVFGATVFAEADAQVVGHTSLARALADRRENYLESLSRLIGPHKFLGTDIPKITNPIETTAQIDLGGRVLEVQAWSTAHTGTDLTVLDQETSTLFAGDLVFDRHLPALDGQLRGWQKVLNFLRDVDVQRVVPGHGGPVLNWPQGSDAMQTYLETLARDTSQAIAAGERLSTAVDHIAESEAPKWDLFEAYNPRNATVAYTELEWE